MFLQSLPQEMPATAAASLSLQDLLDDCRGGNLSEYLCLSVTSSDGGTRISITTTGSEPVTYTTVISAVASVDIQSLVFAIQGDRRND